MNNKLIAAAHVTRTASPWVGIAAMLLIAAHDLKN